MGRIPEIGSWPLLLFTSLLVGCGPEVALIGDDGTSMADPSDVSSSMTLPDTSSSSTTSPAASSDSGPAPICTPGAQRCDDGDQLETCADDGQSWAAQACPPNTACVPCEGERCEDAACLDPCDAGNPASSTGCSFLVARQLGLSEVIGPTLDFPERDWPSDGLLLLNPSETATANVDLYELGPGETEPGAPAQSLVLGPGSGELVAVGSPLPSLGASVIRVGLMTWVQSDSPIVAYSYSPLDPFVGNDSSMLLPEAALGQHYVVPSYPPHYHQFQGAGTPSYFDVLATAPNTTVRWRSAFTDTWTVDLPNNRLAAGTWSDLYTVGRFAGLRILPAFGDGDPHDVEVSGTVIEASAPVYVIGGSRCSAVPESDSANSGCDPLTEALIPLEQWGSTYVVPPPPPRKSEDHLYRIYGGDAGITLDTDPPTLDANDYTFGERGDYVDVIVPFGTSFSVTADGPIMVVGYLASRDLAGGIGDPAMYQLVSFEQADVRYRIGAPAKWDAQYLQVSRALGSAAVFLDGVGLDDWQPAGSGYEYVTVLVEPGPHTLDADDPFVVTQFGYNNSPQNACAGYDGASTCNSSYAHPAGMRAQRLYEP